MDNGGATAAQRRKECRGFVGLVGANGGLDGSEVGGVRSPAAEECKGPGGVDHCRRTAALGGVEGSGGGEGRESPCAGEERSRRKIREKEKKEGKEKERKEKEGKRNEVQSS